MTAIHELVTVDVSRFEVRSASERDEYGRRGVILLGWHPFPLGAVISGVFDMDVFKLDVEGAIVNWIEWYTDAATGEKRTALDLSGGKR